MTMIERVAKAILAAEGRDPEKVDAWNRPMWKSKEKEARAAIAAMQPPDGAPLTSAVHPGGEDYVPPPGIDAKDPERKTMVGRVAYQLWSNVGKQLSLEEEARLVIAAMREPTPRVVEAGSRFCQECADSLDAWHAMIDEALKEP